MECPWELREPGALAQSLRPVTISILPLSQRTLLGKQKNELFVFFEFICFFEIGGPVSVMVV